LAIYSDRRFGLFTFSKYYRVSTRTRIVPNKSNSDDLTLLNVSGLHCFIL